MFEYQTENYAGRILNRDTWGAHINSSNYTTFLPKYPDWLNPLQKHEWWNRGLVVWDATIQMVTRLYANYALKILKTMKDTDTWKTDGFVIGSPAYRMSIPETRDKLPENKRYEKDGWVLTNQIKLSPKQVEGFFKFLVSEEETLSLVAANENNDVREAYAMVAEILLERRKKIRKQQTSETREESSQKKIVPISIPKGNYLTIQQIAEICNISVREITSWIQSGDIEAIDLPGIGKIVEMGKFTQFLNQRKPSGS
jgi:hypothetical protein